MQEEQREQSALTKSVSATEMLRRPEEIDAAQEAEEERRIAKRRQRAADIGDQEDEEDDHVRVVAAVVVGAQQRADHQHRGAGRADELASTAPSARSAY